MLWPEIREVLATVRAICPVEPISEATHDLGLAIAERYGFSIYDGLIIAAASLAGCSRLYSEDLQDGQVVEGVTVCKDLPGIPCMGERLNLSQPWPG